MKGQLSADIFCYVTGKKWSAIINKHPENGGNGTIVWERHGMRSERNSEFAMEAAWNKENEKCK